jgi:hypothetical protein
MLFLCIAYFKCILGMTGMFLPLCLQGAGTAESGVKCGMLLSKQKENYCGKKAVVYLPMVGLTFYLN